MRGFHMLIWLNIAIWGAIAVLILVAWRAIHIERRMARLSDEALIDLDEMVALRDDHLNVRQPRPITLDEWLIFDELADELAVMVEDQRSVTSIAEIMGGAMTARYQWAIAKLGLSEGDLLIDTASHDFRALRELVAA